MVGIPRTAWAAIAIGLVGLTLIGCQQKRVIPLAEADHVQEMFAAFEAYEQGDCITVARIADPEQLAGWQPGAVLRSTMLLRGFCLEIDADPEAAKRSYRELVAMAPNSFAGKDANERLQLLERMEQDSDYAQWVNEAEQRASSDTPARTPIDRVPAEFPPAARAAGVDGHAIVEFGVTPQGATEEPIVVESSPPFVFDGASLRAVREWQYTREPGADARQRHIIRIVFDSIESEPGDPDAESAEP